MINNIFIKLGFVGVLLMSWSLDPTVSLSKPN